HHAAAKQHHVTHGPTTEKTLKTAGDIKHAIQNRPVPWFSQYDAEHVEKPGDTACFRTCRAMAAAANTAVPDHTRNRIQVAKGEDAHGRVIPDAEGLQQAKDYLDAQLEK